MSRSEILAAIAAEKQKATPSVVELKRLVKLIQNIDYSSPIPPSNMSKSKLDRWQYLKRRSMFCNAE